MKMTKEDFTKLSEALKSVETKHGKEKMMEFRNKVGFSEDQFTAFVWGVFHAVPNYFNDYVRGYYAAGMNDTHIGTALKKALKEYK